MRKKNIFFILWVWGFFILLNATSLMANADTLNQEPVATGWNVGALPAVAYTTDVGFRYGALANLFYYGDGEVYPNYLHSLYFEWSRTTKGNGLNNFFYDSNYLIPDTRTTFDLMYLTEQALDFYGFNGYEAFYDRDMEDGDQDLGPENASRYYYRHDRRLLRITTDFQRRFYHDDWKWLGGTGFFGVKTGPVDRENLNDEEFGEDQTGIYEKYVDSGVIPDDMQDGGNTFFLKAGIIHDTRDQLSNPMKGVWTEAFVMAAPSFLGNGDYAYLQGVFIHRHYITLYPERLSLANRLGYQGRIAGSMPFYMLPFIFSSYKTNDGFGGSKTVRGIRRNRVQGDGIAYANFELRYKAVRFHLLKQNFYISTSGFADAAMVAQKYDIDYNNVGFISAKSDRPHWGVGVGVHAVMNENFVVAVNYGFALDEQDGDSGLYIGLNFLY